jgi:hypothetical protein
MAAVRGEVGAAHRGPGRRLLSENDAGTETETPAAAGTAVDPVFLDMAREAARTAYDADFESRRGLRLLEDVFDGYTVCVIYDNNFYKDKVTRRDQALAEFRRWVADNPYQVGELAFAEYPDRGKDEGYSYALVINCEPAYAETVEEQYRAATQRSLDDLSALADGEADYDDL